jgi:quercetin dioxygenase-like cupin family protein
MTKASTTFVHHYAGVAIIVGLLSSFGTWTAMRFVTASSAQPVPAAAKPLLVQPLADLPGREVRIMLLDRAPGSSSPPHRHPGHHTFGYVVEGTYEFAINGEPGRILNAGETFYEPPTADPLRLSKPKRGQAHEDHRVHGRRSEKPEHGRRVSALSALPPLSA